MLEEKVLLYELYNLYNTSTKNALFYNKKNHISLLLLIKHNILNCYTKNDNDLSLKKYS